MDLLEDNKAVEMWLIHLSQINQLKIVFKTSWKLCLQFSCLSLQHASTAELLFAVLVQEAQIAVGSGY